MAVNPDALAGCLGLSRAPGERPENLLERCAAVVGFEDEPPAGGFMQAFAQVVHGELRRIEDAAWAYYDCLEKPLRMPSVDVDGVDVDPYEEWCGYA